MTPLALVGLTALVDRTCGRPEVMIGLIDGPVAMHHPALAGPHIREISGSQGASCTHAGDSACSHGTFVAGVLSAKRGSIAPAICPGCTLLVRPIFAEHKTSKQAMPEPAATPDQLARAILDCLDAGARILNVSSSIIQFAIKDEPALEDALDRAARVGAIVVVAAGNQGVIGGTAITRHPWVLPVVAYDQQGKSMGYSNLSSSIGRRGLGAPGDRVTSLGVDGQPLTRSGTSAATPFVTGTIALLWSEFPGATAAEIKLAVTHSRPGRRNSLVPPLLDARSSYQSLVTSQSKRRPA